MKVHIQTFALLLFPASAALADCPTPADGSFAAAAKAKFDCSSSLPLKGHETDRKFQIHHDFPKTLPDNTKLPSLTVDPFKNPADYMQSILNYVIKVNARPDVDCASRTTRKRNGAMRRGSSCYASPCAV